MAATEPHGYLVDEIQQQISAALTLNASNYVGQEWPSAVYGHWPHDCIVVKFGPISVAPATNEADRVTYAIQVAYLTKGPKHVRDELGRTLSSWIRTTRRTLAERASDASPLRTNPLPLSGHDLAAAGACFQSIAFGSTQTGSGDVSEGITRAGAVLPILVTLQETATG